MPDQHLVKLNMKKKKYIESCKMQAGTAWLVLKSEISSVSK